MNIPGTESESVSALAAQDSLAGLGHPGAMTVSAKTLAILHKLVPESDNKSAEETLLIVVEYIKRLKNKVVELTMHDHEAPSVDTSAVKPAASAVALNGNDRIQTEAQQRAMLANAMGAVLPFDVNALNTQFLRDATDLALRGGTGGGLFHSMF